MLLEHGSTVIMLWAKSTKGRSATFKRTFNPWWKIKIALPISQIDDYVKHIFREYNREADHWANLGAEGQRKILWTKEIILKDGVRAFWDGSFQINGRSGCGVVIKGVDRNKWITVSKIAVPLGICTALTAEVAGVCVLAGILVFVLSKKPQFEKYQLAQLSRDIEGGMLC